MPIQVFIVWLIGLFFIYLGYLIMTRKAPTVIDYFLKLGITIEGKKAAKIFGTIIVMIGIIVILLPLLLGVENMNL